MDTHIQSHTHILIYQYTYTYIYLYLYVCMYVCMHACMHVFVVYVKQLKYMYMYAMVIRVIDL